MLKILKKIGFSYCKGMKIMFYKFFFEYGFLLLIFYFLFLFYSYENSLYNLYVRSFIFGIIYLIYKLFYKYCIKNSKKIKEFFKNNIKINKIGLFIYKWSHIYFYGIIFMNIIFDILKKLRYIMLIKYDYKILKKLMYKIDGIIYYGFYLIIESFIECYITIYGEFKKKLQDYSYKNYIKWRINMLIFSVIIIVYVISYVFTIESNFKESITFEYYILRLFIISNIIIFVKSLGFYRKNYYIAKNQIFMQNGILILYSFQGPGFSEIPLITKIYESRYFLKNLYFQDCIFIEQRFFNGYLFENKYGYRFDLFYNDIENNIDIVKFQYLIFILNVVILKYNFGKGHLDLLENEIRKDNVICILNIDDENTKLYVKHEDYKESDEFMSYILKYKNKKNIDRLKERLNIYGNFIIELQKLFLGLEYENIQFDLILNHNFTEDYEVGIKNLCYENIGINFKIKKNNFKFKNKNSYIIFNDKLRYFDDVVNQLKIDADLNNNFNDFYYFNTNASGLYFFEISNYNLFSENLKDIFLKRNINIESENINNILVQLKKIYNKNIIINKNLQKFPKFLLKFII